MLFVAAIVVYLVKEDSAYSKVAEGVSAQNSATERVMKESKDLKTGVDAMLEWQKTQMEFNDKLLQRLQLIDMRLDSAPKMSVNHKDAPMPQPLKVELTAPIKVIYRESKATQPPALPRGKQNDKSTRK